MSIPVQFASFKSAGVYRIVYDKSTVLNQDAEILRLVVGFSEKGPFNVPTYIKSVSEFKNIYGDISKKLEKRGVYFHRMAIQALAAGPILCLNLKKFEDSNVVSASAITTGVALPSEFVEIDTKSFPVTDIYDRTRFWKLEPERLTALDFGASKEKTFINISAVDSIANSGSYFIRKASGNKVKAYDITVSDWYKSTGEDVPEYLEDQLNAKISDFFAEIYVFGGEFVKDQVLASDTLKNYFEVKDDELCLKPYIINAFGDASDTLEALFSDETSNPVAHYVGCLIPYFKDKFGSYQALDIIFNEGSDDHHMMMNMNADLLDTDDAKINLSGADLLFTDSFVSSIKAGTAKTSLLGNENATVFASKLYTYNGDVKEDSCNGETEHAFESSVAFINCSYYAKDTTASVVTYTTTYADHILNNTLSAGDAVLGYNEVVFVQNAWVEATEVATDSYTYTYCVSFSGDPKAISNEFIRIDHPLNQEIGTMKPICLKGYEYPQGKPAGTDMKSKLDWQNNVLDTLNDTGIHTALLNKSEIDYRYIIDTFESYVDEACKSKLSLLAKEKDSCFAILNFPSVRTFMKCPYASFTDAKGIFNVQYVVDGANRKKAASMKFSLPADSDGASYCAFYTPLRFSDGYVDSFVPSAGLVSNLFMEKYKSRQPYYIVAGPNYAVISAAGLVGPDYKYSRDELNIIEPYGVNCMVYRPGFGTFINANQTAKQTPKSALSSVNVRELVIYLQDEVEKILQAYQWEFNNATVRNAIKDKADYICERIKKNGGLQDYLNVMDESNNTADIIDNEMAVLSTHIEPGRGMGKMIHELTIYRTGQMRSSIASE